MLQGLLSVRAGVWGGNGLNVATTLSSKYFYTFQGQEKQEETGWNFFKWRNYDPSTGRFFNVDPLAEDYAYQSPYNFSENAVVNARELEGLEKVLIIGSRAAAAGAAAPLAPRTGGYTELKRHTQNSLRFWAGAADTNYNIIRASGMVGVALANRLLNSEVETNEAESNENNAKENKGNGSDDKAAINKRPSGFRKKTVEKNWDDAENGSEADTKACPDCGKDVKGNPHKKEKRNGDDGWDVDHQPKIKDREPKATRKEVLDDYNEGTRLVTLPKFGLVIYRLLAQNYNYCYCNFSQYF